MLNCFLWIGKSKYIWYQELINLYGDRLKHYTRHEVISLKELRAKNLSIDELKQKEADLFLSKINDSDYVVLLDERGKQMKSIELSLFLQKRMNVSTARIIYIIGGAYGVDPSLLDRADYIWSLSQLTLTHDMARILLLEQVYRGYTIIRGEKYHNE